MKKELFPAAFLLSLFLIPLASASGVTRSFSKSPVYPGETVIVTLDVAVTGEETYYLIDEAVPQGWTIINPDPATQAGHFKVAVIQGAKNTSYTYEVKAPALEGTSTFSGTYMFEGMKSQGSIGGQQEITAGTGSQTAKPGYEVLIAPVVIIGALAISFALYKSKSRQHG
ncbi:MAG: hypothetical protein NTY20_04455 [Candidatus Aenigmarchaeota archaeon]|nr:hypothetical protein [Candidatus Aenigmarchaeota archaeon]